MRRDGTEQTVALQPLVQYESRAFGTVLSLLATSLAFFVVGTFVGLSRPRDELPRLLALAGLPAAAMLMAIAIQPATPFLCGWQQYPRMLLASVYPFHYILAYRFFLHVAAGARPPRFWRALETALWVVGVVVAVMRDVLMWVNVPEFGPAMQFASSHAAGFLAFSTFNLMLQRFYNPVLTLSSCVVLAANYRAIPDAEHRRRLKWIVYGTLVGLGPLVVDSVVRGLLAASGQEAITSTSSYQFFYRLGTTVPVVVPITFGYAIARHRVLGVQVVVRRGLQYLLARNVLRLGLSLPAVGLAYTLASNADQTIAQALMGRSVSFYAVLLAGGALSIMYRPQLTHWLDRRFFREAYNQEQILLRLLEDVKASESVTEVSRLVCDRVQAALHPSAVHVFYRDPERPDFQLGHSSSGGGSTLSIPEHFATIGVMQARSRLLELPPEGPSELPSEEERWFRGLGVTVLIAMNGADSRLCGLLLLGDKKSEEPYAPGDRELLQAIAGQAAIVWENVWLKEGMRRELQIRRDVLARLDSRGMNLLKECPTCGRCFDRADEACSDDGSTLLLTLPVERTVDGRYRLEQRLGRGGMGVVYSAVDERLRRAVAVKVLHGSLFGAQDALRRFEREAQASARLNHVNVVGVYDYGALGPDGAYLVMERLHGSTWRAELGRAGRIEPLVLAGWFDQVLTGLEAAHARRLVHRDLKPENLMICPNPGGAAIVKILDFGLAKDRPAEHASTVISLTAPGTVLGTWTYMSPEQLSGGPVDERTDLFAVGVIAVESLTGTRPFQGKTFSDLLRAVLHDPFHLAGGDPAIRQLDSCLQRALAKNPEDRYPSAAALRVDLVAAVARCPPFAPAASTAQPADADRPTGTPRTRPDGSRA